MSKYLTSADVTTETALEGHLDGSAGGKFNMKMSELRRATSVDSALVVTLDGTTTSVAIPAKTLVDKIVVIATGTGNIAAGTAAAGTQVLGSTAYANGQTLITPTLAPAYFASAGTLHFSLYTGTITVRIYTR